MTGACCELTWLKHLLENLGVSLQEPALLHCDNRAAFTLQQTQSFMRGPDTLKWTAITSEIKSKMDPLLQDS